MTADLVTVTSDGTPTTTSLIVASGTNNEHASVLRLIRDNIADFTEFGGVGSEIQPFDTAGGVQRREVAILNEQHATLLLTYMRNNDVVKAFKKNLVREFWQMRREPKPALTGAELLAHAVIEAQAMLTAATERIAELEPKAEVADKFLDADGDLSVRDAAQSLTRAGVKVGQNRLFGDLERRGWIARGRGDGRYRVLQTAIEGGWMSVLPQSHYHPRTGVLVVDAPQPRITPKGLQRLLSAYGGAAA